MAGELHEKCAVAAVSLEPDADYAPQLVFESLFAMQHRGTEATGIVWKNPDDRMDDIRGEGMVKDVYREESMRGAVGRMAIGQNRYATSGPKYNYSTPVIDPATETALGHNGNLPDPKRLTTFLEKHNIRTKGRVDTEWMNMGLSQFIRAGHDLPNAAELAFPMFEGAATCVAMHDGLVVAFRDPYGIRPGVIGELDNGLAVASETCGLDILGATYLRDIRPGEMVILNGKQLESRQLADGQEKLDIFEAVYFMRPDSIVHGESVYMKRYRAGQELALLHPPDVENGDDVVVVPVPDTATPAAEGYAEALGLRHRSAIAKNRYIGRTFMEGYQHARKTAHRRKHNIISEPIRDKHLIFVDDSIVRLNTHPALTEMAYERGAKSVTILIASPPVRFSDFYGIDTPFQRELAAANMTPEQMRQKIECKYLGFLTLSALIRSTGMPRKNFNLSCFTGEYPIPIGRHARDVYKPVSMEYID